MARTLRDAAVVEQGHAIEVALPLQGLSPGHGRTSHVWGTVPWPCPLRAGSRLTTVELPLESVPNFSEGRDAATIRAIGAALGRYARLLDVHADADHNRSVFTLVGTAEELADALSAGVGEAKDRIDLRTQTGVHPRVGAA